ncbi:MAG: AAA family ATPase, partial [Deltaproteobacteria bacterium]
MSESKSAGVGEVGIDEFARTTATLKDAVGRVVVGQVAVVEEVLMCLFAGGHALLEGAPGLGKTLL